MRIAIVNDMLMAVESLRRVIQSSGQHEVAWVAQDGAKAVDLCRGDVPDLILMDLIMPVMDGVEATRQIMEGSPCPILLVTSSVSEHASLVFTAMGHGALDAVNTPNIGMDGRAEGRDALLAKIATIEQLTKANAVLLNGFGDSHTPAPLGGMSKPKQRLVVIGSSSGGPQALLDILSELPENFPAPIVVVQHVESQFAEELGIWLDRQCEVSVRVARRGDKLEPGLVLIGGTDDHMVMGSDQRLDYSPHPREQVYRPSVDVFMHSMLKHWQGDVVALLLTGMGRDGAQGLLACRNKGFHTIAQDRASCAVYGMPKAAVELDAAKEVLPLAVIADKLRKLYC